MIFSEVRWIKDYSAKLDKPLRKELFECYRGTRHIPCIFKNLIKKIRYTFKRIDVIVRYSEEAVRDNRGISDEIVRFDRSSRISSLGSLHCRNARLSPKKINMLLQSDAVSAIYLDRKVNALLDNASPSLNASHAWQKDITGKGITTAVLDTGIYPHNDLVKPKNRIVAFKDFVGKKAKPYDDNGHGTHVAGDIAGNGYKSNGLYKAPAYESKVAGVKILDKYGSGKTSTIIQGLEWCLKNKDKFNIKIICMSLGSEATQSYKEDILCEAAAKAWESGIVVCVAAGNDGPGKGTISSPGIHPRIITVGAANDMNTVIRSDDEMADFSSRGPTIDGLNKPDVICPGTNIISLRSPFSYLDKQLESARVGKDYLSMSGTSMATPLCCASAALLLEKNPGLTPDQVKEIIIQSSQDMGFDRNTQGWGYVDIQKLMDSFVNNISASLSSQSE